MPEQSIQEALALVDQVVAAYRGSRQEHVALQQAMEVIKGLVPKPKDDKTAK